MSSADKRQQFLAVWPALADELVQYMEGEKMPQEAVDWFRRVSLHHFLPSSERWGQRS